MSSCIIPTDIIIECECELEKDQYVTIGFKPSTKTGFDKLPYGKFNKDANKYTTKFKKIRQAKIKSGINHVRLPIRFINEKLVVKMFILNLTRIWILIILRFMA